MFRPSCKNALTAILALLVAVLLLTSLFPHRALANTDGKKPLQGWAGSA